MCWRQGADIRPLYDKYNELDGNDLKWVKFNDSHIFKKAPYLWPINDKNSWMLNVLSLRRMAWDSPSAARTSRGPCQPRSSTTVALTEPLRNSTVIW